MNVITLNYAATEITEVKWDAWSKTTLNDTHRHQDSPQLQESVERRERVPYKDKDSHGERLDKRSVPQENQRNVTVSGTGTIPARQCEHHPPVIQWSRHPSHHPPVSQWPLLDSTSEHTIDHSISTSDYLSNPPVGWISNPRSQDEHKYTHKQQAQQWGK